MKRMRFKKTDHSFTCIKRSGIYLALSFMLAIALPLGAQQVIAKDPLYAKAFNLAVKIVDTNTHQQILAAGGDYGAEWTRDIAINSWNAVSLIRPGVAQHSLWSVTENKQLVGHQYWDKIIWVIASLNHYQINQNKTFLKEAYRCGAATMKALENAEFDATYGLFKGPSVFNDGIAGYPEPIFDPSNNSTFVLDHKNAKNIKTLSTNCIYYGAYKALAKMADLLQQPAAQSKSFTLKGERLKANIVKHLYDQKQNRLNYLIDHRGKVDSSQEGMGIAFAAIFGVLDPTAAKAVIGKAHTSAFGLPSIYPDFPRYNADTPGRHNNIIWPVVNGFYAKAAIVTGNYQKFDEELKVLAHLAMDADKGNQDFKEIYNPYTGKPDGGWQSGVHTKSCNVQTWSATAYLDMVLYGVFGLRFDQGHQLVFKPYLPKGMDQITLNDLKYGGQTISISLTGKGSKVKSFIVNGKTQAQPAIASTGRGHTTIKIVLG
jgi:hypothetical protein